MMELLLGAGSNRSKKLHDENGQKDWSDLITLDIERRHNPDVIWDLNEHPWPFVDNLFDEIHAYHVLEHLGRQGDLKSFFADFYEIWRILKPNGKLFAVVPSWADVSALGDPGHARIINEMTLGFLSQANYARDVGKTVMADYRALWSGDFDYDYKAQGWEFGFRLIAVKPSRACSA